MVVPFIPSNGMGEDPLTLTMARCQLRDFSQTPTSLDVDQELCAPINYLGIVYHQYCSSSYLDYCRQAMEIKIELDTKKTVKAAAAIVSAIGLCCVSRSTQYPQLTAASAIALIIIVRILYFPHSASKKTTN